MQKICKKKKKRYNENTAREDNKPKAETYALKYIIFHLWKDTNAQTG